MKTTVSVCDFEGTEEERGHYADFSVGSKDACARHMSRVLEEELLTNDRVMVKRITSVATVRKPTIKRRPPATNGNDTQVGTPGYDCGLCGMHLANRQTAGTHLTQKHPNLVSERKVDVKGFKVPANLVCPYCKGGEMFPHRDAEIFKSHIRRGVHYDYRNYSESKLVLAS